MAHSTITQMLLATALIVLAVLVRIADPDPVARLRLSAFDSYLRLAPRDTPPDLPVRIIDIDEASLARLGQWPWPRLKLAAIIDRLSAAGVKAIAVDIVLAEPDRLSPEAIAELYAGEPSLEPFRRLATQMPSNDARLARSIAGAPVVLGFAGEDATSATLRAPLAGFATAGDDARQFVPTFRGAVASLPVLAAAARGLGAVNWLPEHDQVVRRVPTLIVVGGTLYPSLALETLRVAHGQSTILVRASGGSGATAFGQLAGIDTLRVGGTVLPVDGKGELWLRFAPSDPRRSLPAHRVLEPDFDPGEVAGRIVVIGASAVGLLDQRTTPLAASVPGVEVHAQAIEQMLEGVHLARPAWATGAELLLLVGIGALVAWAIGRVGPFAAAALGAASILAIIAGSWLAYTRAGLLLDPVYPSLALVGLYLACSLTRHVRSELERARVRAAFAHYVAAPLVEELAQNHDKLRLGGEMREVTVLFADVRGFSHIAEGLDAQQLIGFVNRLFTPLAEVILEHRGTIDKFMGDAVMAFWNAPLEDPDHARVACRAALAMTRVLESLNAQWAGAAESRGEAHKAVRIGIGLNTGVCCVGNMGSPQRFDYSILGDAVNIASRLETATKTYGASIMVGQGTAEAAQDFALLEMDHVRLPGKERAEAVFALIGDETLAASERFIALRAAHASLMAARKAGDKTGFAAALATWRALEIPETAPLTMRDEAPAG